MRVLRHAHEVSAFIQTQPDSEISALIRQRHEELFSDDETSMEELVFFVIPGPDDTVACVESALGSPMLTPDGSPLWELIEAHDDCYEMVFVLSSSGYGALVLVSKEDAHPDLSALCRIHALPEQEVPTP